MSKPRHNSRTKLCIELSLIHNRDNVELYLHCKFQSSPFSVRRKNGVTDRLTEWQTTRLQYASWLRPPRHKNAPLVLVMPRWMWKVEHVQQVIIIICIIIKNYVYNCHNECIVQLVLYHWHVTCFKHNLINSTVKELVSVVQSHWLLFLSMWLSRWSMLLSTFLIPTSLEILLLRIYSKLIWRSLNSALRQLQFENQRIEENTEYNSSVNF